jgi:tetratricopeptide (TPR) repeat protein
LFSIIVFTAEATTKVDVDKATEILQSCLEIDPTNLKLKAKIHLKIAKNYFETGKSFAPAIRHAALSFTFDSNCVEALQIRAESYFSLKMFVNASADCDFILKLQVADEVKKSIEKLRSRIAAEQNKSEKNQNEEENSKKSEKSEDTDSAEEAKEDGTDNPKPDSSYSAYDCQNETVDNRSYFAKMFFRFKNNSPTKKTSTQYSYSSADNSNFKEFVEKPKPKPQKSYKELQNEIKAEELNQKGCKEFKAKRFSNAVKFCSDAILLCPKVFKYHSNRASAYMNLENFPLAVADAIKCIEIDGSNWKGYSKTINCFLALGDVVKAEEFVKKFENNVVGIDSIKFNEVPKLKSLKTFNDNIEKLFKENHYDDCLKNIESAMKIATSCAKYREMKIECLIMAGKFNEAVFIIADTLAINPRNSNCIFMKGLNYYHKGSLEDSLDNFELALKLDPDHQKAKSFRFKAKKLIDLTKIGKT